MRHALRSRKERAGIGLARAGALASLILSGSLGYRTLHLSGLEPRWDRSSRMAGIAPAGRAGGRPVTFRRASSTDQPDPTILSALGPPPRAGPVAPVGATSRATIDFETFADGTPACTPCDVSDEWSRVGLELSFRSWSADSRRPYVLDAREYLPPGRSRRALGPSLTAERGLEVGVIRLDFPGRPCRVSFSLFGPDILGSFDVTVWSDGRIVDPVRVARGAGGVYSLVAGRGSFREERIVVDVPAGIDRIALDGWGPPGHMLLVDDLVIEP